MAKHIILEHNEPDILAVFMPYFMKNWRNGYTVTWRHNGTRDVNTEGKFFSLSLWFYYYCFGLW